MDIREYLQAIGRKGGRAKTPAKLAAARCTLAQARLKRWPVKPKGKGKRKP